MEEESQSSPLRTIVESRFTLILMLSNLLIYLLMATTEYNYYNTFDRLFDPGTVPIGDEGDATLTQFLGKALTGVSITNLVFGLFFYSRLLRRFGIGFLLPITPLILIFAYSFWQREDALWIALIGYFVVEGTTYVIDDANFTHLLNGVPSRHKPKIRVAIESFFEPIGTLIAALLLSRHWINPKILGLLLSLALLMVAIALRRHYLKAIWANLAENAVHFKRRVGEWFQVQDLKEAKNIPFALECLAHAEDRPTLLWLMREVEFLPAEAKAQFIRSLESSPFSSDPLVIELALKWLMQAETPLLIETLYLFLAKKGLLHPDKLSDELNSDNLKLKGAAILTLLTTEASWSHKALATEKIGELLESHDLKQIEMGLEILAHDPSLQNFDIALSYLTRAEAAAAKALYKMATKMRPQRAPRLASHLLSIHETEAREYLLKTLALIADPKQAETILRATVHFRQSERRFAEDAIAALGLKNVPLLFSLLKNTDLPDRARLTVGKALGKIALFQLRDQLETVLKPEIERAIFYLQHTQATSGLLSDTLKADYESVLDFIIQLLAVAGEIEDPELLSRSLKSPFPKVKSHAIEAIERSTDPKIFRELQPLLEETLPPKPPLELPELLARLKHSSSLADKIVAYTYMKKLNLPAWQNELKEAMTKSNELFKHFAYELLE